jgi:large subunit ribosomal protein L47
MNTPEEDIAFGRPWCVEELRGKSWEDLHALWWVCAKERNRIATESYERKRLDAGYGDSEARARASAVSLSSLEKRAGICANVNE